MELPSSSQQNSEGRPRLGDFRTQITSLFASSSRPVSQVLNGPPSLEEHPAFKSKKRRLGLRFLGSRDEALVLPENSAAVSGPSPSTHDDTVPAAASSENISRLSPPYGRTNSRFTTERHRDRNQYVGAWVRRPRGKRPRLPYRTIFKDRIVRKNLVTCIILGLLLLVVVAIYLGFTVAFNSVEGQEFHILLILLIMIFTIFFCHSLARTCMLVLRVAKHGSAVRRVPSTVGPLGYAQPERPIHVVLARDEEIAAENQEAGRRKVAPPAPPPPAYGLWRSSVRINPDMIFWQRIDESKTSNRSGSEQRRLASSARPPSYASDNGVDYVIDAQPRSTAPVPLHSGGPYPSRHDSTR